MAADLLYLKPEEGKFLVLSVLDLLERIKDTSQNPKINWNPETRKQLKDMREAGDSLKRKLVKLGFDMTELPPFMEGDQDEFLTKES